MSGDPTRSGMHRRLPVPLARLIRAPRFRSAAITVGGNLGGALAALAAVVVAARTLDQSQFALFGVGLAVNSLMVQVADLGLSTVTVAETTVDWDLERFGVTHAKVRRLAWHRLWSVLGVAVATASFAVLVPGIGAYREVVLVVSGGAVFGSLSLFLVALLQSAQRFGAAAALQWTAGLARLLLVGACAVAGLTSGPMLVAYTAGAPMAAIVLGLSLMRSARRNAAGGQSRPVHVSLDRKLRGAMTVGGLASAGLLNADVLLLVLLSDRGQVAAYVAASRIAAGVLLLNNGVAYALAPSVMVVPDPWHEVKRLLRTGVGAAVFVLASVPLITFVGLTVLGRAGDHAGQALVVLLVAFAFDAFVVVIYQIYLRIWRAEVIGAAAVIELVVMVSVTVALRRHGALAPAIGQLSARVVGAVVVTLPIIAQQAGRVAWFKQPAPSPPLRVAAGTGSAEADRS